MLESPVRGKEKSELFFCNTDRVTEVWKSIIHLEALVSKLMPETSERSRANHFTLLFSIYKQLFYHQSGMTVQTVSSPSLYTAVSDLKAVTNHFRKFSVTSSSPNLLRLLLYNLLHSQRLFKAFLMFS